MVVMDVSSGIGLAVAFTAIALASFALVFRNLNSWLFEPKLQEGQKLPPGELGWPIMGVMAKWLKHYKSATPDMFIREMDNKWGRIGLFKSYMFAQPTVLATTPETIKFVLTTDDHFYPGWPKATNDLMGKKSFTSININDHKRLRALTVRTLNGYEMLNRYIPRMENAVQLGLDDWSTKDEILFLQELKTFAFNIIIDVMMSYKPGHPDADKIGAQFGDFNKGLRSQAINFPGFAYYKAMKARGVIVNLVQKGIDERRKSGLRTDDVLQFMMDTEDETGRKLTDEELVDMVIMYLNAGHESSAHTIMWITIYLNANPDIYAKCKKEQEWIRDSKKPGEGLTLSDFRKMKYLHNVIDETLRISSVSVQVFRKCIKEVEHKGMLIPKGWTAQAYLRNAHQDPEVWPEPLKFNPDRWIDFTPKAGTFVPFGLGTRMCPGNDFAKLEVAIFVHLLTLRYRIERLNPDAKVIYLPHPRPYDDCPVRIRHL